MPRRPCWDGATPWVRRTRIRWNRRTTWHWLISRRGNSLRARLSRTKPLSLIARSGRTTGSDSAPRACWALAWPAKRNTLKPSRCCSKDIRACQSGRTGSTYRIGIIWTRPESGLSNFIRPQVGRKKRPSGGRSWPLLSPDRNLASHRGHLKKKSGSREPFSALLARSSVEDGSTSFRSVDATACDFCTKEKNHVIPKRGNSSKVVSAPPPDGPVGCHHAVGDRPVRETKQGHHRRHLEGGLVWQLASNVRRIHRLRPGLRAGRYLVERERNGYCHPPVARPVRRRNRPPNL